MQATVLNADLAEVRSTNGLFTYIAIPIDSLKQTSQLGASIELVPSVLVNLLQQGDVALAGNIGPVSNRSQVVSLKQVVGEISSSQNELQQKDRGMPNQVTFLTTAAPTTTTTTSKTTTTPKASLPFVSKKLHTCPICGETFETLTLVKKHVTGHNNVKRFKCQQCYCCFNVEDNLELHAAIHKEGVPTCPVCGRTFQRRASLKAHLMIHQVDEMFTCVQCMAEFDSEDDLNKHFYRAHPVVETSENGEQEGSYVCSVCGVDTETSKAYKKHMSQHFKLKVMMKGRKIKKGLGSGSVRQHKCDVCGKNFSKLCLLERHMRIHTGEKPFACNQCDRSFTQKGTLQIHLARHSGIKPYQCTLCPAKFCQKGNLRAHVQKTHVCVAGVKTYKCVLCNCIFKRMSSLNAHITRMHPTNDKDNIADNCLDVIEQLKQLDQKLQGSGGNNNNNLDNNKQLSGGDKTKSNNSEESNGSGGTIKYVRLIDSSIEGTLRQYTVKQKKVDECHWYICNYCIKDFKKPSDLIRHMRTHTKERPYKCEQCGQTFSLKSTLTTHIETHSTTRGTYKCAVCFKIFATVRALNAHLRRHIKNTDVKCIMCDLKFDSMEQAKLHVQLHHPDEDDRGSGGGGSGNNVTKLLLNSVHESLTELKQPMVETENGLVSLNPPKNIAPNIASTATLEVEKPHKCHYCGDEFAQPVLLKRHVLVHTRERKHKCNICLKSFFTSCMLRQHMSFHSEEKKHMCKLCGKKFATNGILKRHLSTHNLNRLYVCPYCKLRFKNIVMCRKHIKVHKWDSNIRYLGGVSTASPIQEESGTVQCTQVESVSSLSPDVLFSSTDLPSVSSYTLNISFDEAAIGGANVQDETIDARSSEETTIVENVANSKISYLKKDNGIVVCTPEITGLLNQEIYATASSSMTQVAPILPNYEEATKGMSLGAASTVNLASMQDPLGNLNKQPEALSVFINFDDLQNLTTSNLYNTCLPQLKNIDPILTGELGEIPDSSILFSADPTLTQITDAGMDVQSFDSLVPFSFNSSGLATTASVPAIPFASKTLANVLKDQEPALSDLVDDLNSESAVSATVEVDSFGTAMVPEGTDSVSKHKDVDSSDKQLMTNHTVDDTHQTSILSNILNDSEMGELCLSNFVDISCSTCKMSSTNMQELMSHQCDRVKRDDNVNENLNTKEDSDDAKSIRKNHGGKIKCKECNKLFNNKTNLNRHMVSHKEKKNPTDNTCSYCSKHFGKHSDLQRHIRTHTGEKPFTCSKCQKKFTLKSTLSSHMRTHEPSSNKDFSCAVCGSNFSSKASMRVHLMRHTGIKPFACTLCPEKFRTAGHRKSHMNSHMKNSLKKNGRSKASRLNNLLQSVMMETHRALESTQSEEGNVLYLNSIDLSENRQDFSETDLLFANQNIQVDPTFLLQQLQLNNVLFEENTGGGGSSLPTEVDNIVTEALSAAEINSLIRVDEGDPQLNSLLKTIPLTVEQQLDRTNNSSNVNTRVTKETPNRNFECDICHKKYTTKAVLTKHKKIHEHLTCNKCNAQYETKEGLSEHLRLHEQNNDRIFRCPFCDNKFNYLKSLKTHTRRIHDLDISSTT